MKHASRLRVTLILTLAGATLTWLAGCSRQTAAPSLATAANSQLPFERASDSSGISPTAGFTSDGIPTGTELNVQIQSALSSADAHPGDSFQATLAEPIVVAGKTLAPQGTPITGKIVAVNPSKGLSNPGYLRLTLLTIGMNGQPTPLQTASMFFKGGWYGKGSAMRSGADSRGDVKFSTGHRLTFRLARPLRLPS